GIIGLVFRDLSPVQDTEPVTLEHFFPPPALEGDDLSVNIFFATTIEITQIRTHQSTRGGHFSRIGQEVDVEMWDPPRCGRNFAPAIADDPANELARTRVVTRIAQQRAEKQDDVLIKRVNLIPEWFA